MPEALASKIHAEFKQKPESQFMAAEFALIVLSKLVASIKPKRVLEIGAGIGTITKLLLQHPNRPTHVTATEANAICLIELEKNLKDCDRVGYKLLNAASELNTEEHYDLVIFDGTLDNDRQYEVLKLGTWCFVEGSRSSTIHALKAQLSKRNLFINLKTTRPEGTRWRYFPGKFLGLSIPRFKRKLLKGCSVGQVVHAV